MADLRTVTPNIQLPLNAPEQRDSAHFQEINYLYHMGMMEMWKEKYDEIADERAVLRRHEKLTEFADPKYVYRERKFA